MKRRHDHVILIRLARIQPREYNLVYLSGSGMRVDHLKDLRVSSVIMPLKYRVYLVAAPYMNPVHSSSYLY